MTSASEKAWIVTLAMAFQMVTSLWALKLSTSTITSHMLRVMELKVSLARPHLLCGVTPKSIYSFYSGRFVSTVDLKLNERWGSCYTAHDGGLMRTAGYNNRLILSKGLTLEVYRGDKGERVGIKSIMVTIMQLCNLQL